MYFKSYTSKTLFLCVKSRLSYNACMLRLATIQMCSTADVENNLRQAAEFLERAAEDGADFALLPEYFPIISDDETDKLQLQEKFGEGPLQTFLSNKASELGMWIAGGTIPIRTNIDNKVASSCLLYSPEGNCTARYDKMHLFDVCVDSKERESYKESRTITPGREVVVADTPFAKLGLSICYDLRFPELYREMVAEGAKIITVPSAFTFSTGKRHWQMLLSARAVENLCFVIASNQCGNNTDNRRTWGHSMIIDPWGDILCSMEHEPGVACADIDLSRLEELRHSFPALEHRVLGSN